MQYQIMHKTQSLQKLMKTVSQRLLFLRCVLRALWWECI